MARAPLTEYRYFDEQSPVGDSQGNGLIESGVKSLEGMVRTIKFALEDRIGRKISVEEPVFAWIVEHSADLLTKFNVGRDGLAPLSDSKANPLEEIYMKLDALSITIFLASLVVVRCPEGGWMEFT